MDTNVRRVWQLAPDRFALTNPDWQSHLTTTVQAVHRELGAREADARLARARSRPIQLQARSLSALEVEARGDGQFV